MRSKVTEASTRQANRNFFCVPEAQSENFFSFSKDKKTKWSKQHTSHLLTGNECENDKHNDYSFKKHQKTQKTAQRLKKAMFYQYKKKKTRPRWATTVQYLYSVLTAKSLNASCTSPSAIWYIIPTRNMVY